MPLYEYQCSKCGNVFEVIQRFSDQPLTVHEGCGGEVVKLISRSAFQLKGSGWYATDYAHKAPSGSAGEAKGDGGKGESGKSDSGKGDSTSSESKSSESKSSESKSSDSKPETKSESKPAPTSTKSD
jgi:putative FmdB family regulatory protein